MLSQGWSHHTNVISVTQARYDSVECQFCLSRLNSLMRMSSFERNSDDFTWSGSDSSMALSGESLGRFSTANCLSGFRLRFLSGLISSFRLK